MDVKFKLKKRSEMHLARKIWHIVTVFFLALVYYQLQFEYALAVFILLWLIFVPADFLRLKKPSINEVILHAFGSLMRDSEVNGFAGTTFLLTGTVIITLCFPREIVLITLLYLAFADPAASFVGIKYGKDKIFRNKSVQGSFAAFCVCAIITLSVLLYKGLMVDRVIIVSLLGGLIGATAEAAPLGKIDDNFSIPILSAIGLSVLFYIFGGFTGKAF